MTKLYSFPTRFFDALSRVPKPQISGRSTRSYTSR